jgi:hypothetical protein
VITTGPGLATDLAEDITDIVSITRKFALHIPASKLDDLAGWLYKVFGDTSLIDKAASKAKSDTVVKIFRRVQLRRAGFSSEQVGRIVDSGASLKDSLRLSKNGVKQDTVVLVAEDSGKQLDDIELAVKQFDEVWVVSKSEWDHIRSRHITGRSNKIGKETDYFPTGDTIPAKGSRPSHELPNRMSEKEVKMLIMKAVRKKGDSIPVDGDVAKFTYRPEKYGIEKMKVIVNEQGEIITAYPTEGPAVDTYVKGTKKWD